ncbi:hypothetical protein AZOA_45440 [Azoarcus sp. Aa7]|nr:hypothetical protein [Azoarcus sp. Aa7]
MQRNVIRADEFEAARKLIDFATWLENNRPRFTAILSRGVGSPCYATVLQELKNLQYELYQWLLHMPK